MASLRSRLRRSVVPLFAPLGCAFFTLLSACGRDVSLGGLADADGAGGSAGAGGVTSFCQNQPPVPASLRELLKDVVGFGRAVTGGSAACVYHVTSLADSGAGTLREAAESDEPLWIVFDVSGELVLASNIQVRSHKTIDGRGAAVVVRDYGFLLRGASNVIIENLTFLGNQQGSSNDGIALSDAARAVWIDHCSLSSYGDGLIDITRAATDVTVSWCRLFQHDHAMLIGASREDVGDADIRVTLHHNYWQRVGSYTPRLRFGKVHLFNNLIEEWRNSAGAATMSGQLYSESNVFVAGDDELALSTSAGDDPDLGWIKSSDDLLVNDAVIEQNEAERVFVPATLYDYSAVKADSALQSAISSGAGILR